MSTVYTPPGVSPSIPQDFLFILACAKMKQKSFDYYTQMQVEQTFSQAFSFSYSIIRTVYLVLKFYLYAQEKRLFAI